MMKFTRDNEHVSYEVVQSGTQIIVKEDGNTVDRSTMRPKPTSHIL